MKVHRCEICLSSVVQPWQYVLGGGGDTCGVNRDAPITTNERTLVLYDAQTASTVCLFYATHKQSVHPARTLQITTMTTFLSTQTLTHRVIQIKHQRDGGMVTHMYISTTHARTPLTGYTCIHVDTNPTYGSHTPWGGKCRQGTA